MEGEGCRYIGYVLSGHAGIRILALHLGQIATSVCLIILGMNQPTLGRRLNDALAALLMSAQGPAIDPSRDQISGGKADSAPPPRYGVDEIRAWVDRAERLVMALEREVGLATPTKPRKTTKDLREVIRTYEGRDAVYVAFVEGCSTQLVHKVRASVGLDPEGQRRPRALTSRVLPDVGQDASSTEGMIVITGSDYASESAA